MWKEQKSAYEAIAVCVTDARQPGIYLFYIRNKVLQLFYFKIFHHYFGEHEKSHFRNLFSIQTEAISLVAMRSKECDWSRKITPLSYLTQMASRGMKTCSGLRSRRIKGKGWRRTMRIRGRERLLQNPLLLHLRLLFNGNRINRAVNN